MRELILLVDGFGIAVVSGTMAEMRKKPYRNHKKEKTRIYIKHIEKRK